MLRRASCAAFILSVAAALCATGSFAITKDFDQSYPLLPGGSFELQNVNGTVEVEGWDRDAIEVHAVKTAKGPQSDLELVSIEVDAKPHAVSVVTRYPQNEGVEVAVEYVIHVPHTARVEHLGTVNGALRIAGVESIEDLRTVNGNIEVYEGGGAIHAHTTNGNVHLEMAHLGAARGADGGEATAETTNGSLLLAIPPDAQANVEAKCLNGNFSSELPLALESTLRPREIHGKLGAGGTPIHLRTVNGAIRVVVLRSTV
jgi:Putative adhesin